MSTPLDCPADDRLRAFLLGDLVEADSQSLLEHVEKCSSCEQRIESLDNSADDVIGALRAIDDVAVVAESMRPDAPFLRLLQPPQSPDEIGRLGGFRVLRVLGHGGMGVVFEGLDVKLGRTVALKSIHPRQRFDSAVARRFLDEARTMARVSHPHIARIYEVDDDHGTPYFAMEFLKGEALEARLKREPILPAAEIVRIGKEIADGLSASHAMGIIHRDIKPANIWLQSPRGTVKLIDFGLARPERRDAKVTATGMIVGTPAYMAPEQTGGGVIDGRADLFSLGVVLYRMATGRVPFEEKDAVATLVAIASKTPVAPRQLNPSIPPGMEAIICKLLSKSPNDRYQKAHEARDHLDRIGQTNVKRLWWSVAGMLAVLIVIVAIGLALTGLFSRPSPSQSSPPPTTPVVKTLLEILTSPDYVWSAPENLGPVINATRRTASPTLTDDELILVYTSWDRLHIARRDRIDQPFLRTEPLPDAISAMAGESSSISGDGLLLVVTTRDGPTVKDEDVYLSQRRSVDEAFGPPVLIPSPVRTKYRERAPVLSADGLTLLVNWDGSGSGDIVQFSRKSRDEPFEKGPDLGENVNTPSFDVPNWISDDGRVLFTTKMAAPPYETRFMTRADRGVPFGPPRPTGLPVQPGRPWLSPDGLRVYFHSREVADSNGDLRLYVCRRLPKS